MSNWKPETLAIHGGYRPDPATGTTTVPLHLATAYQYKSVDHAVKLFDLQEFGYIYTRLSNPTTTVLEDRITQMEGGVGAVATSSGQFAEFLAITTLAKAGDEIVASGKLYGGTYNLFKVTLPKLGITVHLVDQDDPAAMEAAINDKTKAIYIESVSNPGNEVPDFASISAIAKKHKLPLMVDNTYTTPYLFRPKEVGADIVIHSLTKFIGGHSNSMGGIVVDLGTFDWTSGRFADFTSPDPSYHGVVYAEQFGSMAFAVKMRVQVMRDIGGCIAPMNSFFFLQGLETLHVRMDRHVENAMKLAQFLEKHPKVVWVNYPDLASSKTYDRVKKYMPKGSGAMLSFGIKGGLEAGVKFIEGVKLCLHVSNLGDVRTLLTHPASTTHRQLGSEVRAKAGVPDELIRVSVGIESIDDIIADFEQALANA